MKKYVKKRNGLVEVLLEPGEVVCTEKNCQECSGTGRVIDYDDYRGGSAYKAVCQECQGKGKVYEKIDL